VNSILWSGFRENLLSFWMVLVTCADAGRKTG
jgi:hypothetical protein